MTKRRIAPGLYEVTNSDGVHNVERKAHVAGYAGTVWLVTTNPTGAWYVEETLQAALDSLGYTREGA